MIEECVGQAGYPTSNTPLLTSSAITAGLGLPPPYQPQTGLGSIAQYVAGYGPSLVGAGQTSLGKKLFHWYFD
jgi:hypothetical protein